MNHETPFAMISYSLSNDIPFDPGHYPNINPTPLPCANSNEHDYDYFFLKKSLIFFIPDTLTFWSFFTP